MLLALKRFLLSTFNMWYSMLSFGIFLDPFAIFNNLLLFKEFFGISQIWTASDSNNRIKWVQKWYSCYRVRCEALPGKWKEISNILLRKHNHECVAEWFLNSKKTNEVWKSWDLSRSHDIIRGACGKKLRRFRIIYHVRFL